MDSDIFDQFDEFYAEAKKKLNSSKANRDNGKAEYPEDDKIEDLALQAVEDDADDSDSEIMEENAAESDERENEEINVDEDAQESNSDDYVEEENENADSSDSYEDFYSDVDDEDFIDVNEESLNYSGDNKTSVLFDELNGGTGSEENGNSEIREEFLNHKKKSFDEINRDANKFKSGRMNKNAFIYSFVAFLVLMVVVFEFSNIKKKAKAESIVKNQSYVDLGDYNPDFGDYSARGYKPSEEEEKVNDLLESEKILTDGNKEDFIQKNNPVNYAPSQVNSAPAAQSVSTVPPVDNAVVSDIRYRGEGFGRKSEVFEDEYYGNSTKGNNVNYPFSSISDDEYRQNYVNSLLELQNSVNGSEKKNNGRFSSAGSYDSEHLSGDISVIPPNSIYPGTIIHAAMINGINTDYPGTITARIINNVYDSRTGQILLIPSGSILRGSYSSSSIGVKRVQIAWQTLIINRDGRDYAVNLGGMVGVDRSGYSGIKGSLNDHAFEYLKAAGISSLFTYINSNVYEVINAQKSKLKQEMISDSQEIGNKLADKILDRALDIQPTVKVKPGTKVSVDVDQILTLIPCSRDLPNEKYIRK